MTIETESQLIACSLALLDDQACLTAREAVLARHAAGKPAAKLVNRLRSLIRQGHDPLGTAFGTLRTSEMRRGLGATYTPAPIIASMVDWAKNELHPSRVVDPGSGSGRFLIEAAAAFPTADLIAIEADPVATLMLRANLAALRLTRRSRIILSDYVHASLAESNGPTLFIGNPPYVRHHELAAGRKDWYARSALDFGVKASKLAGLHVHFFVRTLQLARRGDIGCFITAAEWLDVNYGLALRQLLAGPLGGTCLTVLDPTVMPFPDATTTGAITGFRIHARPEKLTIRTAASLKDLSRPRVSFEVPWQTLESAPRWSVILKPGAAVPSGHVELGELCRVHRGQVTGSNNIWIAGLHSVGLPARFLTPTVTRARELIDAGDALRNSIDLRQVIDLPVDLEDLTIIERRVVEKFLRWAKQQGADDTYVARHRRAWWSVGLKPPAPILCTYMARRPPAFVRNLCGARHINIAHGIYPREPLTPIILDALANWLRSKVEIAQGRSYAGGLIKFEPKEVERLPIPAPERLVSGAFV
jgi:methylase of polypeptide subunit release factors